MTLSESADTAANVHESQLHCVGCGYNLTGVTIGSICPECGQAVEESLRLMQNPKTSGNAVTCLVLGILSLTILPFLGPVAIIWYFLARREIAGTPFMGGSRGMAIAGLAMGIIGTIAMLVMMVAFLGLGAMAL